VPADNKVKPSKPPQVSRFDRGPRDFWRGSRGKLPMLGGTMIPVGGKSFIGLRRGSR